MKEFYVYALIDERNDSVFYIGKGCGRRMYIHVNKVKNNIHTGINPRLFNKINSILQDGYNVREEMIQIFDDEKCSYSYEKEVINKYGLDNLCNIVEGGCGAQSGDNNVSKREDVKMKISKSLKKSYELRSKLAKEMWNKKGYRDLHKKRVKLYWTEDKRKEWSEKMKKTWEEHPELKKTFSEFMKENNPSFKEEVKNKLKASWTEERKIKFKEIMCGENHHCKREDVKEKLRKVWTNEKRKEVGEKVSMSYTEERRAETSKRFKGENGPNSKLTFIIADEIRELYKTGNFLMRDIAKIYDLNKETISRIINNKIWVKE